MKAGETSFLKLMNGVQQFIVPIYQRTYSWDIKQCNQLWNDILNVTKHNDGRVHFIGSIVYIDLGTPKGKPQQMLLIDGQQRITTLSLILIALYRHIIENHLEEELSPSKIRNYFLFNSEEKGNDRIKLLLTEQDKLTFNALLNETEEHIDNPSLRILENFNYFKRIIASSKEPVASIYEGVDNRLMLVSISLEKTQDNPQLIFESMNSTGKDLTQADLIRNYILMGEEPEKQEELYLTYWRPMERSFGQKEYEQFFDLFVRDFLTSQNVSGKICRIEEVYDEFKSVYNTVELKREALTKLFIYSKYYLRMHLGVKSDADLDGFWQEFNQLVVTVHYPFFLRVYDDYENGLITKDDFIQIIKYTISYVLRRSICEIPTNSMNKTFATFYPKVNKADYLNSIVAEYVLKDSYRAFPTDEEFKSKFVTKSVYSMNTKNYILEALENHDHKEKIKIIDNGYTVEHILPQNPNLNSDWITMLGENWKQIQSAYLHTIGNLTLTKYNTELSDSSFEIKKTIKGGFIDSHLRLNAHISRLQKWDEEQIKARALSLADIASAIWVYPKVDESVLAKYRVKPSPDDTYDIEHHRTMMSKATFELFEDVDRRIMSLYSDIKKVFNKWYISYKLESSFVDLETCKDHFNVHLYLPINELNDPLGISRDVSNIGHMGTGLVEIKLNQKSDRHYLMELIVQSLNKQVSE